jgi:hypothetical protein
MNKTKKILFAKAQGVLQRGTVATLCIVFVTFFTAVSCEKPNALLSNTDGDTTMQKAYPINITTIDFSLTNGCYWQWQNLKQDTIYVINSQEDFSLNISCENTATPEIDFNEYSLIMIYGGTTSGISNITKQLQQVSDNEYELKIDITLEMTTVAPLWRVSLLIPKLQGNFTLETIINKHN